MSTIEVIQLIAFACQLYGIYTLTMSRRRLDARTKELEVAQIDSPVGLASIETLMDEIVSRSMHVHAVAIVRNDGPDAKIIWRHKNCNGIIVTAKSVERFAEDVFAIDISGAKVK